MAALRTVLILLFVAALALVALFARGAFQVAVGYSAKQLCSGVFVAGLPQAFVEDRDIRPRMAILGPALSSLTFSVDPQQGIARAEFLGVRAQAIHRGERGCALHGTAPGQPALPPVAVDRSPPVPQVDDLELGQLTDAAFAEPAGGGRNTLALLVSHRGKRIVERYAAPVSAATRMQGWSMNKSLMSTWVAIESARGSLDPQRPIASTVAAGGVEHALAEELNLLHLLQMESGLDFSEIYGPGSDVTAMLYRSEAMWTVPASQVMAHAPGTHFAYSSGDTVLASYLWQQSLGQPYEEWIRENFSEPLGLRSLVAEADASGVQVGSSYVYMTGRDWLRVGELWLDAWHGRSPLLSQEWLRESATARASDERGRYGRGFWLNTGGIVFPDLPQNLFIASGNAGQSVIVIPEWELVMVRLGLSEPGVRAGNTEFLEGLARQLELH